MESFEFSFDGLREDLVQLREELVSQDLSFRFKNPLEEALQQLTLPRDSRQQGAAQPDLTVSIGIRWWNLVRPLARACRRW